MLKQIFNAFLLETKDKTKHPPIFFYENITEWSLHGSGFSKFYPASFLR